MGQQRVVISSTIRATHVRPRTSSQLTGNSTNKRHHHPPLLVNTYEVYERFACDSTRIYGDHSRFKGDHSLTLLLVIPGSSSQLHQAPRTSSSHLGSSLSLMAPQRVTATIWPTSGWHKQPVMVCSPGRRVAVWRTPS